MIDITKCLQNKEIKNVQDKLKICFGLKVAGALVLLPDRLAGVRWWSCWKGGSFLFRILFDHIFNVIQYTQTDLWTKHFFEENNSNDEETAKALETIERRKNLWKAFILKRENKMWKGNLFDNGCSTPLVTGSLGNGRRLLLKGKIEFLAAMGVGGGVRGVELNWRN